MSLTLSGRHALPEGGNLFFHLAPVGLALGSLQHQPGNGAAVPGDDNALAALHVGWQLDQMGLAIGAPDLAHGFTFNRQFWPDYHGRYNAAALKTTESDHRFACLGAPRSTLY
jgi:hypothetical protein